MFANGFGRLWSRQILLLCLAGVILGIFFGASPGMTSSMGIALILPVTYGMDIVRHGMSILLGIYIGGSISGGGLITAILINIPARPRRWPPPSRRAPHGERGGRARHPGRHAVLCCLAACSV